MFVLQLPQYENTGVFAVKDNNVRTNLIKMEIQHIAVINKAYKDDLNFIYAVHHYQGALDYIETDYFATEEKAREIYNTKYNKLKEIIEEEMFEIYKDDDTQLYFEGKETCHKLLIEAIIIPEKTEEQIAEDKYFEEK